jgi:hypothetical protein
MDNSDPPEALLPADFFMRRHACHRAARCADPVADDDGVGVGQRANR